MKGHDAMNYDSMDEKLESTAQQTMRAVVKGLPEESLSMAWRSALNEKLIAESAVKPKRRGFAWYFRPALGLGLACSLALIATFHGSNISGKQQTMAQGDDGLEAALVKVHRQTTLASDLAGVGVGPFEMASYDTGKSSPVVQTPQWSEVDLDSL